MRITKPTKEDYILKEIREVFKRYGYKETKQPMKRWTKRNKKYK